MNAKDYLYRIRTIQARIERKTEEIEMLRSMVESTTAPMGRDYIQSSGKQDKFANIISKMVDIENERDTLIAEKFDIVCMIERIEDAIAFKCVYFKFVNNMRVNDICEKLEIAESTFYKKMSVGYSEIDEILKNRVPIEKNVVVG